LASTKGNRMLETIALALVSTLTSFLFEQQLLEIQSVKVDNAPGWFLKEKSDHICESTAIRGDYSSLDEAKSTAIDRLTLKISAASSKVIQNELTANRNENEKELIRSLAVDRNVKEFVTANAEFTNIATKKEWVFLRSCLAKDPFSAYQTRRMTDIAKQISIQKRETGLRELHEMIRARNK